MANERVETQAKSAAPNPMFSGSTKGVEAVAAIQKEFFEALERSNRDWFTRLNEEATLTSDFTKKVTASRSIPDAVAAYQEWATKQMELLTKQSQKIMEDGQNFISKCSRIAGNGAGTASS